MSDNRVNCRENSSSRRENICIDTNRILDSCKDKDCFEDTRVFLTDFGQELIEKGGNIRVKSTKVVWTDIVTEAVRFNRGFYHITIRFFTRITFEVCACMGKVQEVEGIAVSEKQVVLYGSEGNVNIFRSSDAPNEFCTYGSGGETQTTNKPTVVVEVVDPIVLSVDIKKDCERKTCCCCCNASEIPLNVCSCVNGTISDSDHYDKKLYATLGFFSVVRIERPSQMIVNAAEYSVPDKVCPKVEDDSPCELFAKMAFPINEFSPPSLCDLKKYD